MGKRKSPEVQRAELQGMHDFQLLEQWELATVKLEEARKRAIAARGTKRFNGEIGLAINRRKVVRYMQEEIIRRRVMFRKDLTPAR